MTNVSLGIMAYNEEGNIGRLLETALAQELCDAVLKEIIVVASGCTDSTEDIVRSFIAKDKSIRLISQPTRQGKASAINLFLADASGDIFILESADTVPAKGTFNKLIAPFKDSSIGMTGARSIPVNSQDTFIGFTVHFLWLKHHQVALITPKLGELVAFRNFVRSISNDTAVDEASIESIVRKEGYNLAYVEDAIVYNKGPETIRDFIRQRRRITAGHEYLKKTRNYKVSTQNPARSMIELILKKKYWWDMKKNMWAIGAICLELYSRALGYYDFYVRKNNPFIWEISTSTKKWD
ncbi:MAG: glycosyltransferase [PVC group bacterium]|nr:glycosyltransferase [PVC group bacterium]